MMILLFRNEFGNTIQRLQILLGILLCAVQAFEMLMGCLFNVCKIFVRDISFSNFCYRIKAFPGFSLFVKETGVSVACL